MRRKRYQRRILAILMAVLIVCSSFSMDGVNAEKENTSAKEQVTEPEREENKEISEDTENLSDMEIPGNEDGSEEVIPELPEELAKPENPENQEGGEEAIPLNAGEPEAAQNPENQNDVIEEMKRNYPSGGIVFHNTSRTSGTAVALTAKKNLTGKTLEAGMFSFVAEDEKGKTVATAANKADGTITFGNIGFGEAGTYTCILREVIGKADGITYDAAEYKVTVEVADNGDGTLTAAPSYPKGKIVFNNSFGDSHSDSEMTSKSNTDAVV